MVAWAQDTAPRDEEPGASRVDKPSGRALDPEPPTELRFNAVWDQTQAGGKEDGKLRRGRVQIQIITRHGSLAPNQQAYLNEKAGKLLKFYERLMAIEVEVDHQKHEWQVELLVSAEHKHDFVARETASTPEAAMDLCLHKLEMQLRRYKEKVQDHKNAMPHGGTSLSHPDLPDPPESK